MENLNKFNTDVINLHKVVKTKFIIPTYQRPYVWKEEQIQKLIKDCAVSFTINPEKPYFIGTVLTSKKESYDELIDGQQRFTTLWLIAVVFHKLNIKTQLTNYLKYNSELRLGFEIRKEVEHYFELLEKSPSDAIKKYSEEDLGKLPFLKNISKAVTTIEGILKSLSSDLKQTVNLNDFGDYLYQKVLMINNSTPRNIDLNKLFATINNSGIQLEQTDIVKSNLLKHIKSDKLTYSRIWEACENMNDFFERNVRKLFSETKWDFLTPESFEKFDSAIFQFMKNKKDEEIDFSSKDKFTIRNIIDLNEEVAEDNQNGKIKTSGAKEEIYARSILNFGQLLLHTYRIYLFKNNEEDFEGTFHINRLILIFKNLEAKSEDEIKEFFKLLWQVRYTFDKNIIKWITDLDSKEEHLEITKVSKNNTNSYFTRNPIEKNEEVMLQSVLYFTGDYLRQYWLTPYLFRLIVNKEKSLRLLEQIDNTMSLSTLNDKEISYKLCDTRYSDQNNISLMKELQAHKGTSFKHYWFQKLEYVLWKHWANKGDSKFKNYRITSKNSVEHVYPQHPEYKEEIGKIILDDFGNLALLNVGQNSSYSNQEVAKKKIDFFNKTTYDSLKLYFIYNNENWTEIEINNHRTDMLSTLVAHYVSTAKLHL